MAYVEEWNYDDVRRFSGFMDEENWRKVADEILRLKNLVSDYISPLTDME